MGVDFWRHIALFVGYASPNSVAPSVTPQRIGGVVSTILPHLNLFNVPFSLILER
jgi:hypothetical protein